jgi:uncharacterized membrane protein
MLTNNSIARRWFVFGLFIIIPVGITCTLYLSLNRPLKFLHNVQYCAVFNKIEADGLIHQQLIALTAYSHLLEIIH